MKQITIIRHAKSDWGTEFLKDVDRHLNERGYRDAYFAADWFLKAKERPGLILSSPAVRALSTALIFARHMDMPAAGISVMDQLYEAPAERLLSAFREHRGKQDHLMLFAHNPGITNLCNELSKELFFDNIPTCGIVSFSFDVADWPEVSAARSHLLYYQFPKDFRNTA